MEFEGRKKVVTQLNIAPLIDIVFLLLIFFMLSAHFISQPGIEITLPSAAASQYQEEEEILVFIVSGREIYLGEDLVTLEDFSEKLKMKLKHAREKSVTVKADEGVDLGLVVKILDWAKQAEATSLIISTQTEEEAHAE